MTAENHTTKTNWLSQQFSKYAQATAWWAGQPVAFLLAVLVVLVWIVTGPIFNYSDTWQLVINTGTTIVTFLMVFLIQNTQNRDILTVQLKLSELVLAVSNAENKFAAIEDMSDEELEELHEQCRQRAEQALGHIARRKQAKTGKTSNHTKSAAHRAKSAKRSSGAGSTH
jgi:low affinity Fe/Cu permease